MACTVLAGQTADPALSFATLTQDVQVTSIVISLDSCAAIYSPLGTPFRDLYVGVDREAMYISSVDHPNEDAPCSISVIRSQMHTATASHTAGTRVAIGRQVPIARYTHN